ncbi:hypothetical protein [Vibrio coralliilyticus]|uniref:hypothetical protein n=1 Tax=Vibrio coralliilyticus TaxID=190893 RepID=UPI000BAC26ED|nr:hypothetical protein [Vibrio coralliilyticus]PAW02221.1 hypothetical protein CKJ79_16300 [Vibrio coralliilyticus]
MSEITASIVEEMKNELIEKLDDRENKFDRGLQDTTSVIKAVAGFIIKALNWSYLVCTISMVLVIGSTLIDANIVTNEASGVSMPAPTGLSTNELQLLDKLVTKSEVNSDDLPKDLKLNKSSKETKPFSFTEFFYFYCGFSALMFFTYLFYALAMLTNFSPVGSRAKQEREILERTLFVGDVSEIVEEVLLRHHLIQGGNDAHKGQ